MMRFNVPTLKLREPLKARPIYGLLLGAATGLMFGMISGGKAFATPWQDQVVGYTLAGATMGAIIGSLLPQFRRRWVAGVIVGVATSTGLALAAPFWGAEVFRELAFFFGIVYGMIYSMLFWRYDKNEPTIPVTREDG